MIGADKLSRPLEVEIAIPVRTYDIDFVGIVTNKDGGALGAVINVT